MRTNDRAFVPFIAHLDELKLTQRCHAFQFEQKLLPVETTRIACQATIAADDSMAWDHNADRITSVCEADCADRCTVADNVGKLRIGSRLSVRDVAKSFPDSLLKVCSLGSKWKRELGATFPKVLMQLGHRLLEA